MSARGEDSPDGGCRPTSLIDDTRGGPASQIDFANAVAILMFGVVVFFAGTTAAMAGMQTETASEELTAMRMSDKLVNDLFKEHATDGSIESVCVNDYFTHERDITRGCEHDPDWTDRTQNESVYLNKTLGYQGKNVNVTIRNQDGSVLSDPQSFALGPEPPARFGGSYERYIIFDSNPIESNTPQWYTVRVTVW